MCGTVLGGSYGFFRKVGTDNTSFWKNIITNYVLCTGFDVDYTETYGYAIYQASPGGVVKFDASTGGIISLYSNNLIKTIYTSVTYTLKTSFSSLTMYFSGCDTSFNGFLCSLQSGATDFNCYLYTGVYPSISILSADANILYLITIKQGFRNYQFRRIDFSNANIETWMSQIVCSSCGTSFDGKIALDSSSSILYTLANYNSKIYFISLSANTGSLNAQYQCSSVSCSASSGITIQGGSVYLSFYCFNSYLSVFSIAASTFTNYLFSPAKTINTLVSDGSKLYFGGQSTNALLLSSYLTALTTSPIITSSISMNSYASGQTDSVVLGTVTGLTATLYPITLSSLTVDSTSALLDSATTSDVLYYMTAVTFSGLSSSTIYSKSISLTCSTSGSTSITYSLVAYNGQTLPAWVTLDSANQLLSFTTPTVSSTTVYQFAVQATISASNIITPVYLSVNAAVVSSSGTSSGGNTGSNTGGTSSISNQNNDKYSASISSSTASIIVTTSVALLTIATISTSLISGGSPQSLWSVINLFQYFMLYPMIGAFVPDVVIKFLQGIDFCLFNFNFISMPKSGVSGDFISYFDCISNNSYLSSIGLESVCMIVNQIKLFATFLLIFTIHIPILILYKKFKMNTNCCGKLIGYMFKLFTFAIYIRTIIESTLVVVLTSCIEFYVHDLSSGSKILSFSISTIYVFCLIGFWISTYFIAKRATDPEYDAEATYLNEVVEGTKTIFLGRLLIFTTLTRIFLSVSWVIFTQSLGMITRISIFVGIQVIFTTISIIVRHFKNISDNIIQILNDSIYLFACIALFRYNTETNWADGFITALFASITINGLIITLIATFRFIKLLLEYCFKKQRDINSTKISADASMDEFNIKRPKQSNQSPISSTKIIKLDNNIEEVKVPTFNQLDEFRRYNARETSVNTIIFDHH